jgi:RHS repeat-associated protein
LDESGVSTNFVFNPNRLESHNNTSEQCEYNYFSDGSLEKRKTVINQVSEFIDHFEYDYRGLLIKFFNTIQVIPQPGDFPPENFETRTEWRYWYNPFAEREQKRMYFSPYSENEDYVRPWVYYLLGGNKEQFVVYHGMEIDDPTYDITYGGQCVNNDPPNVFLYPVEYNTFGSGSSVEMTYRFDGTDWVKHFKVTDHLGNIRSVLMDDGMGSYTLSGQYDYKPFGGIFNSYINADNHRQSFIGKEKDYESSLGDFGVRKYDDFTGRFFQIDPMWEKYYSLTPYHYSANNPVSFLDPSGLLPGDKFKTERMAAHDFAKNYNPLSISMNREFGATIYKVRGKDLSVMYTYTIPNIGNAAGVYPSRVENNPPYAEVDFVHSHAAYDPNYDNNNFSENDATFAENHNKGIWAVTPDGSLKFINAGDTKNDAKTTNQDLPSDSNDPDRKNNLNSTYIETRPIPYKENNKTKYYTPKDKEEKK